MTKEEVDKFEKIQGQIEGFHSEISNLAKKSPNDSVNKFKLKFINEVLLVGNSILGNDYKPLGAFEQFNDEDLPTNSDVTFVLSQYLNCLEKLKTDNIYSSDKYGGGRYIGKEWLWIIDNSKSNIKTSTPKKYN